MVSKIQKYYETASEAIRDLIKRGYSADFFMDSPKESLFCKKYPVELSPLEFKIDRFEGYTDPADEMIVYAVSSHDGKKKGVIANAFGIYSSYRAQKLVEHLNKTNA